MQVGVVVDIVQGFGHGVAHAVLVDVAHVEHLQSELANRLLFLRVNAADADEIDVVSGQRRRLTAPSGQRWRAVPEQARHRHAVQVSAGAAGGGVDVGVGVEPDHAQQLALLAAMARDGADRADRQAVVATHQQRRLAPGQHAGNGVEDRPVPGHHFIQVAQSGADRSPRIRRPGQISVIDHGQPVATQHLDQSRHPQRIRSHAGAANAGTDVSRCSDQTHGFQTGSLRMSMPPIVKCFRWPAGSRGLQPEHRSSCADRRATPVGDHLGSPRL